MSETFDEGWIDAGLGQCVLLTKFLVDTVVSNFHLVRLISHGSRLESVVHSFLNSDINAVVFVVISDSVKVDCIAVNSNCILAVSEHGNVVVKVFWVERALGQKAAQFLLVDEDCFLKQRHSVMVLLECVIF